MAFDGHMNLILRDVKEDYTVRLRVERTKVVGRPTAGNPADKEEDAAESGGASSLPHTLASVQPKTGSSACSSCTRLIIASSFR